MTRYLARFSKLVGMASVIVGAFVVSALLCLRSRPSADEYLMAPLWQGFYVDRPTEPLFVPDENFVVHYWQAIWAIVGLGWDAFLNAATFQLIPALLVSRYGPIGTIAQGIVFNIALWLFGFFVVVRKIPTTMSRFTATAAFVLGVYLAFSSADFFVFHKTFGLYPFTGIRFGLYALHAWALLAVVYLALKIRCQPQTRQANVVLFTSVILFSNLVSLWYAVYLFFFLAVLAGIDMTRRLTKRSFFQPLSLKLLLVMGLSTALAHWFLIGAKKRTSLANETMFDSIGSFARNVIANFDSRLYSWNVWANVLGQHALVALATGIVVGIIFLNENFVLDELDRQFRRAVLIFTMTLPVIFVFQEFLTYEAYWHRTTPIAISAVCWMLQGLCLGRWFRSRLATVRFGITLVAILMVVSPAVQDFRKDFQEIRRFSAAWDAGDPFGVGSPIQNTENYNLKNYLRIVPYKHPRWTPPTSILGTTNYSLIGVDDAARSSGDDWLSVSTSFYLAIGDSVFADELGGKTRVSFTFRPAPSADTNKPLRVKMRINSDVIELDVDDDGVTFTRIVAFNELIEIRPPISCWTGRPCVEMSPISFDFSNAFKRKWGIVG